MLCADIQNICEVPFLYTGCRLLTKLVCVDVGVCRSNDIYLLGQREVIIIYYLASEEQRNEWLNIDRRDMSYN
jgi:hypothetical protein